MNERTLGKIAVGRKETKQKQLDNSKINDWNHTERNESTCMHLQFNTKIFFRKQLQQQQVIMQLANVSGIVVPNSEHGQPWTNQLLPTHDDE